MSSDLPASEQQQQPAGATPTDHADRVAAGLPVSLAPGVTGVLLAELTDEEVAVLDGLTSDERLVVLPWLDSLEPAQRDIAMLTAFRSLVARGLATGPDAAAVEAALLSPDTQGHTSVEITVEETVAVVLQARGYAHRIVTCQRVLRDRPDYLYLFEVDDPDGGRQLLGELVVGTGLHRFFRIEDGEVGAAVHAYLVPEPWGEGTAPDVVVAAQEAAAGRTPLSLVQAFDDAPLRAEVIVLDTRRVQAPELHVVSAGPELVRTMSTTAGAEQALVFRTRSAAELLAWLAHDVLGDG